MDDASGCLLPDLSDSRSSLKVVGPLERSVLNYRADWACVCPGTVGVRNFSDSGDSDHAVPGRLGRPVDGCLRASADNLEKDALSCHTVRKWRRPGEFGGIVYGGVIQADAVPVSPACPYCLNRADALRAGYRGVCC